MSEKQLPDSTTAFLSADDAAVAEAASAEAAQAVASLQVSTDMDQFNDLFSVTSCSEPNFTLIDSFTGNGSISLMDGAKVTPLKVRFITKPLNVRYAIDSKSKQFRLCWVGYTPYSQNTLSLTKAYLS